MEGDIDKRGMEQGGRGCWRGRDGVCMYKNNKNNGLQLIIHLKSTAHGRLKLEGNRRGGIENKRNNKTRRMTCSFTIFLFNCAVYEDSWVDGPVVFLGVLLRLKLLGREEYSKDWGPVGV